MELQARQVWMNELGRPYFELLVAEQAELLHLEQEKFWKTRHLDPDIDQDHDFAREVVEHQMHGYANPAYAPMLHHFRSIVEARLAAGQSEISIIEFGCANGPTIRYFEEHFPEITLSLFGLEALPLLVRDANDRHPDHRIVNGVVEDFVKLAAPDFGRERFDLFLASASLGAILPDLAEAVLEKAATVTDTILFRDYLPNKNGELSRDKPVMFEVVPNHKHIFFAHPYETILRRLGFYDFDYHFIRDPNIDTSDVGSCLASRDA